MRLRSFLAFNLSPVVRTRVAALIHDLQQYSAGVEWIPTANLHITLCYFGEVEEALLLGDVRRRVTEVIAGVPALAMHCEGIGVFPNWKYPRVIWAGIVGVPEPVLQLHAALVDALRDLPLAQDEREFRLHLTLGRAKRGYIPEAIVRRVESLGPIALGTIPIHHVTLYKSELTNIGAVYTPLEQFSLQIPTHSPTKGDSV